MRLAPVKQTLEYIQKINMFVYGNVTVKPAGTGENVAKMVAMGSSPTKNKSKQGKVPEPLTNISFCNQIDWGCNLLTFSSRTTAQNSCKIQESAPAAGVGTASVH